MTWRTKRDERALIELPTVNGVGLLFLKEEKHEAVFEIQAPRGTHMVTLGQLEAFCQDLRRAHANDDVQVLVYDGQVSATVPLAFPGRFSS